MSPQTSELTQDVARRRRGTPAVPELVWSPLAAGVLTAIPGLLGLAFGQPWLFPSLGPTAYLQAAEPRLPSARVYNVIVGHLIGAGVAFLVVLLLGAAAEPSVLASDEPQPLRVYASAAAVALALLFQTLLRASHPPAAATTLLITLGGFQPTWHSAAALAAGVVIVAAAGELLLRLRLAQPGQS